jgi:hypothetical protein
LFECPAFLLRRSELFDVESPTVFIRREAIMENWQFIADVFISGVDLVVAMETVRSDVALTCF